MGKKPGLGLAVLIVGGLAVSGCQSPQTTRPKTYTPPGPEMTRSSGTSGMPPAFPNGQGQTVSRPASSMAMSPTGATGFGSPGATTYGLGTANYQNGMTGGQPFASAGAGMGQQPANSPQGFAAAGSGQPATGSPQGLYTRSTAYPPAGGFGQGAGAEPINVAEQGGAQVQPSPGWPR